MGSHHSCSDHHNHHRHHHGGGGDGNLTWAFVVNVLLSVVQVVGGVLSGSLALVADALHNLSDAASLLLALAAQKIGRKAPDSKRTYGYKKVETLSAYTNYVVLVLLSLWLAFEAVTRFLDPHPVSGWTVIWISVLAVVVNLGTVALTYRGAQHSQNVRAAYLHNLGDALSSVGVIVAGVCIVLFGWQWMDPLITLAISMYIIWHVIHEIPVVANILIDGNSDDMLSVRMKTVISNVAGVKSLHHFHVRSLDEHRKAVEAHIVMNDGAIADELRKVIKLALKEEFQVDHAFLEIESVDCGERGCST
jgi:cobalt-zinc-cadmium efflux system protein